MEKASSPEAAGGPSSHGESRISVSIKTKNKYNINIPWQLERLQVKQYVY
jgi:hypothetical protein